MSLRDKLHDRIDLREELSDDARTLVETTVKERLQEALDHEDTKTVGDAMHLLAAWVAEGLDELTTKAVRRGVEARRAANEEAGRGED
jgi:hypothetical protein